MRRRIKVLIFLDERHDKFLHSGKLKLVTTSIEDMICKIDISRQQKNELNKWITECHSKDGQFIFMKRLPDSRDPHYSGVKCGKEEFKEGEKVEVKKNNEKFMGRIRYFKPKGLDPDIVVHGEPYYYHSAEMAVTLEPHEVFQGTNDVLPLKPSMLRKYSSSEANNHIKRMMKNYQPERFEIFWRYDKNDNWRKLRGDDNIELERKCVEFKIEIRSKSGNKLYRTRYDNKEYKVGWTFFHKDGMEELQEPVSFRRGGSLDENIVHCFYPYLKSIKSILDSVEFQLMKGDDKLTLMRKVRFKIKPDNNTPLGRDKPRLLSDADGEHQNAVHQNQLGVSQPQNNGDVSVPLDVHKGNQNHSSESSSSEAFTTTTSRDQRSRKDSREEDNESAGKGLKDATNQEHLNNQASINTAHVSQPQNNGDVSITLDVRKGNQNHSSEPSSSEAFTTTTLRNQRSRKDSREEDNESAGKGVKDATDQEYSTTTTSRDQRSRKHSREEDNESAGKGLKDDTDQEHLNNQENINAADVSQPQNKNVSDMLKITEVLTAELKKSQPNKKNIVEFVDSLNKACNNLGD
jgi:hypothetical protein